MAVGRKWLSWTVLVVVLAFSTLCEASPEAEIKWSRYVTADGYVAFDYPEGWLVTQTESGFLLHDEETYEQLWLVLLPYEAGWDARAHAQYFLALIQEDSPASMPSS